MKAIVRSKSSPKPLESDILLDLDLESTSSKKRTTEDVDLNLDLSNVEQIRHSTSRSSSRLSITPFDARSISRPKSGS